MESLIAANISQRPTRTITSILGVAIGVVLIVVTVGLARGILYDSGQRQKNVGAEILFQPPGAFGPAITSKPLSLPVAYCKVLGQVEGVKAVTPVGQFIRSGENGIGFEIIEGIIAQTNEEYVSFAQMSNIHIVEGHGLSEDDEVIIDRRKAGDRHLTPGSTMDLFGKRFRVAGIYEPESGARTKMRLSVMQRLLGSRGKASSILIQCTQPEIQEVVAERINRQFPGNHLTLTRDIPRFYESGIPALTVFLRVVISLATIISGLVVLLAMYTAVVERTREIGILKSLGASKRFIVQVIEQEAVVISSMGVVVGYVIAFLTKLGITNYTSLLVRFELKWFLISAGVVLFGGVAGAFYPAVRAANEDPVKALSYE